MDIKYWENYYRLKSPPSEPSSFAKYCIKYLPFKSAILDVGCGNGRDAIYFASLNSNNVYACDQSNNTISKLEKRYTNPNFFVSDVTNIQKTFDNGLDAVYARFLLHALNKVEEQKLLAWAYDNLVEGGKFMAETRSVNSEVYGQGKKVDSETYIIDGNFDYELSPHKRRFIRCDSLEKQLLSLGFSIIEITESDGLAVYKNDNPVVIRVIAQK